VKIKVGYLFHLSGTVEVTPKGGLLFGGDDPERARAAVETTLSGSALADVPGGAKGLLASLLRTMNDGLWWTVPMDEEAQAANREGANLL